MISTSAAIASMSMPRLRKALATTVYFRTAYDRSAERNDLADEITALARQLAG